MFLSVSFNYLNTCIKQKVKSCKFILYMIVMVPLLLTICLYYLLYFVKSFVNRRSLLFHWKYRWSILIFFFFLKAFSMKIL